MPIIRRTLQSRRDYLDIWSYVSQFNLAAAARLLERFDDNSDCVGEQPAQRSPAP